MKTLMTSVLFLAAMVAAGAQAPAQAPYKLVEKLDPALDQIVAQDAVLEKVAPGTGFFEGPTWIRGRPGYLIFTDVPHDVIHKLGPDGKVSIAVDNIHGDPDASFVFASSVGTPLEPRNVTRQFKALLTAANLPNIRVHDLRHSCATLLLAQGVNPRVVMETLGHSQVSLTLNTYSHVLPALQHDAAARINAILER